jgi:small GTP-binding protein
MDAPHIRNFCIIAHVDHGKTTLSDRLLETTGAMHKRDMREQVLDSMDLERERGITIKAHPVTMAYRHVDGVDYELNLIDTPGHVDFAYEVSRSLAACEGALLIVDAAQGVEAQTVANVHLATKQGLTIVPVINKIDLPSADVAEAKRQLEEILAIPAESAILASAKTGIGIEEILKAVVERIPPPKLAVDTALQALVFDSMFDTYRGVVTYVRLFAGEVVPGMMIQLMSTGLKFEVKDVGVFEPKPSPRKKLVDGNVGYVIANIKSTADVNIGDTMTDSRQPAANGVQRDLPGQLGGLRALENRDGQAEPQRFRVPVSGGEFGGAGVRFPVRIPGAAALGDRAGTAAPAVQHGHHCHVPERYLPGVEDRWRDPGRGQPGALAGFVAGGPHRGTIRQGVHHLSEREHRRHVAVGHGETRRSAEDRLD